MNYIKILFIACAIAFGAIPGITTMITSIGVPPGEDGILYGAIVECFGGLTLLMLWVNRDSIHGQEKRVILKRTSIFGGLAFFCILFYIILSNIQIKGSEGKEVLFPFYTTSDSLSNEIKKYGEQGLIDEYNVSDTRLFIKDEAPYGIAVTRAIFIAIFVLSFCLISLTFGYLGIYDTQQLGSAKNGENKKTSKKKS